VKNKLRKISEMVVSEIGKMNRDQLYQFIQHCQSLTTTNCGWVEYEMKDLLISIAENERDLKAAEQGLHPTKGIRPAKKALPKPKHLSTQKGLS